MRSQRARLAARLDLEVLCVNTEFMVLDGDGVFVSAWGRRKLDYSSAVFYIWAADTRADVQLLAADELFVRFVTGSDDAFVVEDADHRLKPRSDGNPDIHRFLTVADGVVRSHGRKLIFSTNLAQALAEEMAGGDAEKLTRAALAFAGETKKRSLAEVYRALG